MSAGRSTTTPRRSRWATPSSGRTAANAPRHRLSDRNQLVWWPPEGNPVVSYTISPLADLIGGCAIDENPRFLDLETDWAPFAFARHRRGGQHPRLETPGTSTATATLSDCRSTASAIPDSSTPGRPEHRQLENPFGELLSTWGGGVPGRPQRQRHPRSRGHRRRSSEDCDGTPPDECEIDCDGDGVVDARHRRTRARPQRQRHPRLCEVACRLRGHRRERRPRRGEDCNNNVFPTASTSGRAARARIATTTASPTSASSASRRCALSGARRSPNGSAPDSRAGSHGCAVRRGRAPVEHSQDRHRLRRGRGQQQVRIVLWMIRTATAVRPTRFRCGSGTARDATGDHRRAVLRLRSSHRSRARVVVLHRRLQVLGENGTAAFDESGSDAGSWVASPRGLRAGRDRRREPLTTPRARASGRWGIAIPVFTGGEFDRTTGSTSATSRCPGTSTATAKSAAATSASCSSMRPGNRRPRR